ARHSFVIGDRTPGFLLHPAKISRRAGGRVCVNAQLSPPSRLWYTSPSASMSATWSGTAGLTAIASTYGLKRAGMPFVNRLQVDPPSAEGKTPHSEPTGRWKPPGPTVEAAV